MFLIYLMSYYLGILYQALFALYLQYALSKEFAAVLRKDSKDRLTSQVLIEDVFFWITSFAALPYSLLNFRSLYEAGIRRELYPLLYAIVFDYHSHIVLISYSLLFIWFTYNLRPKFHRFQLGQMNYTCIMTLYCTIGATCLSIISRYGRFWYFFP